VGSPAAVHAEEDCPAGLKRGETSSRRVSIRTDTSSRTVSSDPVIWPNSTAYTWFRTNAGWIVLFQVDQEASEAALVNTLSPGDYILFGGTGQFDLADANQVEEHL